MNNQAKNKHSPGMYNLIIGVRFVKIIISITLLTLGVGLIQNENTRMRGTIFISLAAVGLINTEKIIVFLDDDSLDHGRN